MRDQTKHAKIENFINLNIFLFELQFAENLQSVIFFFGMTNSVVNPLIYGAFQLWPMANRLNKNNNNNNNRSSFTR